MNPPPVSTAYHSPPRSSAHTPHHPSQPSHHQQTAYDKHYSHDAQRYEQQPSYSYPNIPRASHLHLPGVNTYIEHYHYYNFNGNCTVQQASGDGQPNTIHMAPPAARQPHFAAQNALDVPPVPPPMSSPLQPQSDSYQPYRHHSPDRYPRDSTPLHPSLPHTHLAPLTTSRPISPTASHLPSHSSLLAAPRLAKPPPSIPETRQLHPQPPLLPRLRTAEPDAPILAPLQTSVPSSLSLLHANDKLSTRPIKRSRLSRGAVNPLAAQPVAAPPPATAAPGGGSDSNCPSAVDDRAVAMGRGPTYTVIDRAINTANSSSPSQTEYPLPAPRTEGFDRSSSGAGSTRATRNTDESQSNDWEAVVEMYATGKGTEDGVALKMITKGDGRRVSDRKLLEKRRTIGKTYECLGVERFERAIGYKWENGVRRKQKMYHVISRCRVVNAMRKSGEPIPTDCDELTRLINGRIAEKEALKAGMARRGNTGSAGLGGGRIGSGGGGGGLGSGMGYSLDDMGRIRGVGTRGRESAGAATVGEVGVLHGGRTENDEHGSGRRRAGHGRSNATNGGGEFALTGRDEDEIRPGRAQEGGRYE